MSETLLPRHIVERRTGLKRTTIYSMMKQRRFPTPVRVGIRAVRWRESDISSFVRNPTEWALNYALHGGSGSHSDKGAQ
ncbi:AlpA family phage regulatory protein [Sphingomonas albertensis]|jgi:prophage regulatory protein|uniref:AlpA family phage regulatory protein n=1 Tax=Sphingomonas albertensis TaxID=2762591 RepID=A0ABR7ANG7_9SPHN|nr:AlpA family phage regulatory protein [Sphingomonas albertensis]